MKKLTCALCVLFLLGLLTACGDEVADDPNLSEEAKALVEEVGGPFSESEFEKFMADLPEIPNITVESRKNMGEVSGEALSAQILSAVEEQGWEKERFMYIYSHAMTMMGMQQMETMNTQMQAQMEDMPEEQKKMMEQMLAQQMGGQMEAYKAEVDKQIPASEQAIIMDNMDDLCTAFGVQKQ
ncbi:hypothetical protein [Pseudodesulfovibrio sediminis]|uniref:Uncharacterized protein n=1 Tax=Pseudodesulfovibrio sediminis TaxID=2810563 RepID=A0ABN6ETQ0_9BACT|nr:hypothetical protein [Pseudodesulfovibrio sediminis]BCS88550.1 hypothetical protein PSDVSF_17920 [Pseudodesulfovibrio sediminis]